MKVFLGEKLRKSNAESQNILSQNLCHYQLNKKCTLSNSQKRGEWKKIPIIVFHFVAS